MLLKKERIIPAVLVQDIVHEGLVVFHEVVVPQEYCELAQPVFGLEGREVPNGNAFELLAQAGGVAAVQPVELVLDARNELGVLELVVVQALGHQGLDILQTQPPMDLVFGHDYLWAVLHHPEQPLFNILAPLVFLDLLEGIGDNCQSTVFVLSEIEEAGLEIAADEIKGQEPPVGKRVPLIEHVLNHNLIVLQELDHGLQSSCIYLALMVGP